MLHTSCAKQGSLVRLLRGTPPAPFLFWHPGPCGSEAGLGVLALVILCITGSPAAVLPGAWGCGRRPVGALEEKPAAPSSLVATALVAEGLLPWLLRPPGPQHVFPFRSRSRDHLLCSLSSGCVTAVWLRSIPWPTRPAPCIQCPPSKCSDQRVSRAGPRWQASLHLPPRSRSPPLASPALPLHGLLFSLGCVLQLPLGFRPRSVLHVWLFTGEHPGLGRPETLCTLGRLTSETTD